MKSHGSRKGDPAPRAALLQMVFGYMASQVIHVAARLGVADHLQDGAKTSEELATATGTHAPSLRRLLRALTCVGVLVEADPGLFALTPLGASLRSEAPDSARSLAMLFCDDSVWRSWGDLYHSVKTGETAFERIVGMGSFEYFARNPELSATFNEAMAEDTRNVAPGVVAGYDFSLFGTLVDVGGGSGTLIAAILKATPGLRGILFDTPAGIRAAPRNLNDSEIAYRCRVVAGDFFESVPGGGDAYILKSVIHDWNDERAADILRNCRGAMPRHGRLLLVEPVLPARVESAEITGVVMSDLNMLVCAGGRERTETEFRELFAATGFEVTGITPTLGTTNYRVIEGTVA